MATYREFMTIRMAKPLQKRFRGFVKKYRQFKLSGIAANGIKKELDTLEKQLQKEEGENGAS